jgi:ribose/xylose/arabinose/galactoside ABC-type transport system permease subunit
MTTTAPPTTMTLPADKGIGHADRRFRLEGLGLTVTLLLLCIGFTWVNPRFGSVENLLNVLTQASTYTIVTMGMTFVISKGGIDLSVGSLLALVSCVAFGMIEAGTPWPVAILVMFALALALGALNGLLIAYLAIPALIATLGTMVAWRGAALLHSAGTLYYGLPEPVLFLGQGSIFGIPMPVIIAGVFTGACYWVFNHTAFGLHCRAVGGNREAARLAGVNVTRIEVAVYTFSGFTVALGALLWMARIDGTQATIGTTMEIHVIAATIIGGTSLFGGRGTIYGALLGAILLSLLNNALVIVGLDFFWQLVAIGVIVVVAVAVNNLRENRIGWVNSLRGRRAAT